MYLSIYLSIYTLLQWHVSKALASNVGDAGSIPGSGRSPSEGHGKPLQYPCQEYPINRGAWWATVLGVANSQTELK